MEKENNCPYHGKNDEARNKFFAHPLTSKCNCEITMPNQNNNDQQNKKTPAEIEKEKWEDGQKNRLVSNQNNNEEWWKKRFHIEPSELSDLDLDHLEELKAEDDGDCVLTVRKDEADAFIASQISQAEQRGKREGLEEARKIFMTRFQECVDDRVRLNKIDQAINQLK